MIKILSIYSFIATVIIITLSISVYNLKHPYTANVEFRTIKTYYDYSRTDSIYFKITSDTVKLKALVEKYKK